MGQFDHEKNILKKYARKGQCFSTSRYIFTLEPNELMLGETPDIKRNGFCFTDGVGYISAKTAELVARKMGYTYASAFQIRIAGAKGVLMVRSDLPEDKLVALRESQIKFHSEDRSFNVIRASTFG